MTTLTDYEIHIFGMNRCGQHAILAWLLGMFNNVLYKNNMGDGTFIVDPTKYPNWNFFYYQNYGDIVNRNKWEIFSPKYKMDAIILGSENASVNCFATNYKEIFTKVKKNLIISKANKNGYNVDTFSKKQIFIPVIRSPHNHAASCLKWRNKKHFVNKPENFIPLWISYAEEYLGITKYLPDISVPINYDEWVISETYKKESFNKMGLDIEYSDKNINRILGFGRGSSFGKQSSAQHMKINDRWKYWMDGTKDNKYYLNMLNNSRLLELSEKIYGKMPFVI